MLNTISDDAQIGEGTSVWQFASVVRGARVGDNCVIGPCALVDASVLGSGCRVGHGASINPGALISDNVFIGPGAIICNDMWPEVAKEGFDSDLILSRTWWAVLIGPGASVGAGAVILPGVSIGANAVIAAGAVVDKSVPAGSLWRRGGEVTIVPPDRRKRRMREAC